VSGDAQAVTLDVAMRLKIPRAARMIMRGRGRTTRYTVVGDSIRRTD
jgi:hypothetical protein